MGLLLPSPLLMSDLSKGQTPFVQVWALAPFVWEKTQNPKKKKKKTHIQNPKESTSLTLQPHLLHSNGLLMISTLSFASSFCVIFICSRICSTPPHSLTSNTKVLCRSRVSSTALVKSSKYTKQSESKLREGREVKREAHLLDKTPVLIASLMGKKQGC